ncbi:MAG: thioredoxin domain-containing protein, partial [Myxococcales bacterium]|nr:thioredoxin domain-containing protein [Myxococcales bacterium]
MPNRLAGEASPYLLQHADNPVDWYPWGAEALEKAKREDKPILLSIGYSACHWCHVMDRESFQNEAIAKTMNDWFVNVKVDREERPDLDQVYQIVVQMTGRSGGWPLTVFLTPDQKPFFAGTYFPPTDRYGMPGFPRVLEATREAYQARRAEVTAHSDEVTRAIERIAGARPGWTDTEEVAASPELVHASIERLVSRFDDRYGGFGARPKFPSTMSLEVLLRAGDHARVKRTLDAMRAGGIFDQLGGGFHRYSTDERWLVPHFEKMLYDNALLLRLYTDAARALGDARYAETAGAIAAYVEREMTSPEGGFYSTQDADSEGEEGRFFVWTPAQVDEACGADTEAAEAAKRVYGIAETGNFERTGTTVLSIVDPPRDGAEEAALGRARAAMFAAREKRPKPLRDEKVLASYSALMISALADAAGVVGPALGEAALRAMRFIEKSLVVRKAGAPEARVLRH